MIKDTWKHRSQPTATESVVAVKLAMNPAIFQTVSDRFPPDTSEFIKDLILTKRKPDDEGPRQHGSPVPAISVPVNRVSVSLIQIRNRPLSVANDPANWCQ